MIPDPTAVAALLLLAARNPTRREFTPEEVEKMKEQQAIEKWNAKVGAKRAAKMEQRKKDKRAAKLTKRGN